MKVTLKTVRGAGSRVCRLTEVGRQGDRSLDTPMCMLYSRAGSAPYVCNELLQKIAHVPELAQVPINHVALDGETIAGYKKGLAEFAHLGNRLVYTSSHDPASTVRPGSNDKGVMGVWAKNGRVKLDCAGFVKIQEAIQPDWFQCMSDADTNQSSTRKRAGKSVDRTLNFLDQTLELQRNSEVFKSSSMFGSLVGGYDVNERVRCARETVARKLEGYVFEGFHHLGPESEDFDIGEIAEIIQEVMKELPEESVRMMAGVWRPDKVLEAVQMGIDIFNSSYPYVVTERKEALIFNYQYKTNPEAKLDDQDNPQTGFTMNLADKRYADDFSPVLRDCTCYTCQNFTRAYINHLLITSELLASILLMFHNFHHYFGYFATIREALNDNTFDQLVQCISQQTPINS